MKLPSFLSPLSNYKIKRLIIIAIAVVVIAISANAGAKDYSKKNALKNNEKAEIIAKTKSGTQKESGGDLEPGIIIDDNSLVPVKNTNNYDVKRQASSTIPTVTAEEYLVGNLDTGEIYMKRDADEVFPIASLSKLITASVATYATSSDTKITITKPMLLPYGDAGHLAPGEIFTVSELLYPLLLESSNDAAEAFAIALGYDSFISQMNSFAKEIGMSSTSFEDPSGLSPENKSNAKDLFILAQYLYKNREDIIGITKNQDYYLASTSVRLEHELKNINPFSAEPNFLGGKTGRTNEAKETMISMFMYKHNNDSYPIVIIILRSDFNQREADSRLLLEQFNKLAEKRDVL